MTEKNERWETVVLIALAAAIFVGSAGIPALLDDADSFYAEVARGMNWRHDWITPYCNSLRYLEKPPLFYWLISLSYTVFRSANEFTARLPTALAVVGLVFVTVQIGKLLFGSRAGLLAGTALTASIGMFLFTRIILPDVLFTLMLSLIFYSFLRWERAERKTGWLMAMYVFTALAVLAKGGIGIVFPAGILFFTLAISQRWRDIWRLISVPGILLFLAIAAPWHVLIGERNPGFYWFYFVNEHLLRFLGKRYPMDYGTVPLVPFWLLHIVWLFPWSLYLLTLLRPANFKQLLADNQGTALLPVCWALTILVFFSFSSRLEYYTVPAFPAMALLAGAQCWRMWEQKQKWPSLTLGLVGALIGVSLIVIAAVVSSKTPDTWLKLKDNPDLYVYYLGHLFDLTSESVLALRTPLALAGIAFGLFLPLHHVAKKPEAKAALLTIGMGIFFVAANLAFLIFAPRLTSKPLAEEISHRSSAEDGSIIVIDGEYEEGCSVAFYSGRTVMMHNGRSANLEYGSRYADAPPLFLGDKELKALWEQSNRRLFLLTFQYKQEKLATVISKGKHELARYGDKILLSNLPDQ
ncbi:MAG: glycosyltransferase family 39 protein [Acidobacteria bacterium]|nr:glycosyltransferase family 39 protein [Acidobacteriota bacterium]